MQGPGQLVTETGVIMQGTFDRNQLHGEGFTAWPSGMMVRGTFYHGRPCGKGMITWPDGSCTHTEHLEYHWHATARNIPRAILGTGQQQTGRREEFQFGSTTVDLSTLPELAELSIQIHSYSKASVDSYRGILTAYKANI